jgi:hypothetical protein
MGQAIQRDFAVPGGAHMRRINPRGQPVTGQGQPGGSNNTHRLIRRGLPYGPVYDPLQPYDGIERGLLGYFINSSFENQYEFVLSQWVNDGEFAGAVRLPPKSRDPMIGTQDPAESIFVIPQSNGRPTIKITGFSTFITTKAAAYCFLPSITAAVPPSFDEFRRRPPSRSDQMAQVTESAGERNPRRNSLTSRKSSRKSS